MKKKIKNNLDASSTKRDLGDMGAQIVSTIAKTLEEYPTKNDLRDGLDGVKTELKADIKRVEHKVDNLGGDISDLRRRVSDLEADTVARREFNDFKVKVLPS